MKKNSGNFFSFPLSSSLNLSSRKAAEIKKDDGAFGVGVEPTIDTNVRTDRYTTRMPYHWLKISQFPEMSSGKEKIFSVRLVRLVRPGFAQQRRGKQKKTKKGLLKYELAFTVSGNSRGDPR